MIEEYCYTVSSLIMVDTDTIYRYLVDPLKLGKWSLGCFNTSLDNETGLCLGHSLFNGNPSYVKIDSKKDEKRIDYYLGKGKPETPRIVIKVHKGKDLGYPEPSGLVTMIAWRTASMTNYEWERLKKCHDAEILMIKEQIEKLEK